MFYDENKCLDQKPEGDPAEFLLSNTKYHDCHLTVGNPETDEVEKIGVSSTQLIAHSPVFRDMLSDSELADPSGSNTRITDVSPATFKLMLRHCYGGKLPQMTPEQASALALCADKYNIQRLVGKAAKRLKPSSAEDVFPAFTCALCMNCPELELEVSKIIQQQTDRIVQNPKFLQLDENCLLFIVKQNLLNISELHLWNSLVRWAENHVKEDPGKTLRDSLNKILPHVRLLSLTPTEILDHVLPSKILTPEEFMDLTLAVSKKQILQLPGLCQVQQTREIYKNDKHKTISHVYKTIPTGYAFKQLDSKPHSTLTIKPVVNVDIKDFTVKSVQYKPTDGRPYSSFALTCNMTLYKSSSGLVIQTKTVTLKVTAVPNEDIVLQVKTNPYQSLTLEANETYHLKFEMTPPLPVFSMYEKRYFADGTTTTTDKTTTVFGDSNMKVKFEEPFHILEIGYST